MAIASTTIQSGNIQKLVAKLVVRGSNLPATVEYNLPIGTEDIHLNELLGKKLRLSFSGVIHCIACQRPTKKSFQQGYCYPCFQTLARCDICIVRPEKCHFRLGTCREPQWAQSHCFVPHIVYLANTSGLKVGITRENQIPTRWIDQGASQALPIARVMDRHQAGLIEVELAKKLADKTDWRKMLKGEAEPLDLQFERDTHSTFLAQEMSDAKLEQIDHEGISIHYPVLQYPTKIVSINLEKTPEIEGTLLGIKGQYLIMDIGVLNVRNISGYNIEFSTCH